MHVKLVFINSADSSSFFFYTFNIKEKYMVFFLFVKFNLNKILYNKSFININIQVIVHERRKVTSTTTKREDL